MEYILETDNLSHRFRHQAAALKNIRMQVPAGSIYGFLGPNGAGKTTTLKLILGLLKKQAGNVTVFGKDFDRNRIAILRQTGSLIESPSLYGQLTALENLQVFQCIYQCPPAYMQEVLKLTGLAETGKKRAAQFSLGMKQRLGIAVALLTQPKLLVLDEPTNGLDPNGIIEIRELLKTINRQQGTTILISSHLLPEIEKLATHTGIIHKGEILFQGPLEELLEKKNQSTHVLLHTSHPDQSRQLLQQLNIAVQEDSGKLLIPAQQQENIAAINRQLVHAGISVYAIQPVQNNLETIFMNLINDN